MKLVNFEIIGKPAYSTLKVYLSPGESVTAEAGAMIAMEGDITIETRTAGGLLRGLLRKITVGESVFANTFRAGQRGGVVWLAPSVPGDIEYVELKGNGLIVQDYSYLAHHGNVDYELKWAGLRGLLADYKSGLIWMRIKGVGGVWVNGYGSIERKELKPGETITVDNNNIVAMDDTIRFSVTKFGGWKSFLLGGEGLVVRIEGPGTVYLQTRTLPPFAEILNRFLPK